MTDAERIDRLERAIDQLADLLTDHGMQPNWQGFGGAIEQIVMDVARRDNPHMFHAEEDRGES